MSGEHGSEVGEVDALERRRKRLRFRSWHRGIREMDLVLGRFADAHLGAFTAEQLDRYAALLENGDPDLYNWIIGREPAPPDFDHDVMKLLRSFKVHELNP